MAQIETGDDLSSRILQPGWSVQSDGFGLVTISANYKVDSGSAECTISDIRGTSFEHFEYTYCKAHKASIVYNDLKIALMRIDFVGIDPTVEGGVMTLANTSAANGLTAENITSHPNFFTYASGYSGGAIAGYEYTQDTEGVYAPLVAPGTYGFMGLNGSCFEKESGGRFIGFVDPGYPAVYGKTQYLARTTTYSGSIYTSSVSFIQALYALLGSATATRSWGVFELIPEWGPTGTGTNGKTNLLSQINVEEFGDLYKVNYEIR
jgi:hypothetical protein